MADVGYGHCEDGPSGVGELDREGERAAEALLAVCRVTPYPPAVDGPADGDELGFLDCERHGPIIPGLHRVIKRNPDAAMRPTSRSFHGQPLTAVSLVMLGLLVAWLPLDVSGFRLVLARGWHGATPLRPECGQRWRGSIDLLSWERGSRVSWLLRNSAALRTLWCCLPGMPLAFG